MSVKGKEQLINYPDWLEYAKWSFERVLEEEEANGGSLRAEYAKRFLKWIDDGAKPEKLG